MNIKEKQIEEEILRDIEEMLPQQELSAIKGKKAEIQDC